MKFSDKDIQHIADLARLELKPDELKTYGKQLSAITGYIDQLQTAAGTDIKSTSPLNNVWREDEVEGWLPEEREKALSRSERKNGLIKVKRVL